MDVSKEMKEAIKGVGGEDEAVALLIKAQARDRLVGAVTVAGLALPEKIVDWSSGTVGIEVGDDGIITVIRTGDMKLTCREGSRQGISQNGRLKWRLAAAGFAPRDKVRFRYEEAADAFLGVKV